jgi:hypothetical protein
MEEKRKKSRKTNDATKFERLHKGKIGHCVNARKRVKNTTEH